MNNLANEANHQLYYLLNKVFENLRTVSELQILYAIEICEELISRGETNVYEKMEYLKKIVSEKN